MSSLKSSSTLIEHVLRNDVSFVASAVKQPKPVNFNVKHNGNTLLHLAISQNNANMLQILLENPKINVNAINQESGYTPLHLVTSNLNLQALYHGHLKLSLMILAMRKDCDLYIRDFEGITPLELLNSTIAFNSRSEENLAVNLDCAVSVYSWGKNSNYILGLNSADDRAMPERITFSENVNQPVTRQIVMSKYHCAVLTNKNDIYVYGFGRNGRLGLGNEETILKPTRIDFPEDETVEFICLGPDHSVAITGTGSVYTWGSNKYGQLGYICENSDGANHQLFPKLVQNTLKKIKIIYAAASKYHTASISSTGAVYTWGLNLGQLGSSNTPINQIQSHAKKAVFPAAVVNLACTNSTTALLTQSYEVWILANNTSTKVLFPQNQISKTIKQHMRPVPSKVCKLVGNNTHLCALTTGGEVWMWCPPQPKHPSLLNITVSGESVQKVWSLRKSFLAAKDVAIGIDQSLVIVTASEHVYVGVKRTTVKIDAKNQKVYYKFNKVILLS